MNIKGTRLMSRLRLGTLWLMARVKSVTRGAASDLCPLCSRDSETPMHFLCDCSVLEPERVSFKAVLRARLELTGPVGAAYLEFLTVVWSEYGLRELWILVCAGFPLPCPSDSLVDEWSRKGPLRSEADPIRRVLELVAQSRYIVCSTCKNFLSRCWQIRADLAGSYRVVSGSVVHTPPEAPPECRAPVAGTVTSGFLADRRKWLPWLERRIPVSEPCRARPNANFYTVFSGFNKGVMYRYWDVLNSIRGFSDAKVKGFVTLAEAKAAFAASS